MPYITQEKRDVLDPYIDGVLNALRELESDDPSNNMEGNINYIVTQLMLSVYPQKSYTNVKDAVGTVVCAVLEYYTHPRTGARAYEDQKEHDNGIIVPLISSEVRPKI